MHDSIDYSVGLLEQFGPALGRPHADTVAGSKHALKELRVQHRGKPYRIFFGFDPRRSAILLIGGSKAGDKRFYKRMIPLADNLYEVYGGVEEGRADLMAGHTNYNVLRSRMSPERRARIDRAVQKELERMLLVELRKLSGMTQAQVAKALGIKQPSLSQLESQDDMQIST